MNWCYQISHKCTIQQQKVNPLVTHIRVSHELIDLLLWQRKDRNEALGDCNLRLIKEYLALRLSKAKATKEEEAGEATSQQQEQEKQSILSVNEKV
jgi:hypothetical protein